VPAGQLKHLYPWYSDARPPWNPLMYDSVGQFYPWRKFAAETVRSGTLPLWNPYQFCGTPFVANSQSAVFYPGNLLHYVLPTAQAIGWIAILHVMLAATFMWLLLRCLGLKDGAGVLGGVAFAFSTWQVSWMHLPTFLNTSCWLPLVALLTLRLFEAPGWRRTIGLGFAFGMALLAGHLQIAFYVVLAAGVLALWMFVHRWREGRLDDSLRSLALFGAALALGGMLAAPQVVPTLELSRLSHRQAPVSAQGYQDYIRYAVGVNALITIFYPDFFGNPSQADNPYFGLSRGDVPFNYAEGALYVGLPTLLLAFYALPSLRRDRPAGYFAFLALLALLMALGTAVDVVFYFYFPGFAQSGSPGRALVLWAFALAALAAVGYHRLLTTERSELRWMAGAILILLLFMALGPVVVPRYAIGVEYLPFYEHMQRQGALFCLTMGLFALLSVAKYRRRWLVGLPVALVMVDLFANGINYNHTSAPSDIYPSTPLTAFLQQNVGHERIAPVNRNWSFQGPRAVLPPNAAMVFGLRDVQGYDSLFPGQYKAFMNRFAGPRGDASPPEVGNVVFAKDPESGLAGTSGVRWLVSLVEVPSLGSPATALDGAYVYEAAGGNGRARLKGGFVAWREDGPTRVTLEATAPAATNLMLADQFYPGWHASVAGSPATIQRAEEVFRSVAVPAGKYTVTFRYQPMGFRFGLFLGLVGVAIGAVVFGWQLGSKGGRRAVSTV
jgi:hypothetical protein